MDAIKVYPQQDLFLKTLGDSEGECEKKTDNFVKKHPPEKYIHVELGAACYSLSNDRNYDPQSGYKRIKEVHVESCKCRGCDYTSNRMRYFPLEETIKYLVENQTGNIIIYLNDIDHIGVDQAYKHSKKYIETEYPDQSHRVEFHQCAGDFFELKLKELTPNSVHIKNPGVSFYTEASKNFIHFYEGLLRECSTTDEKGLILVLNDTLFKNTFDDLFKNFQENSDKACIQDYQLDFSSSYFGFGYPGTERTLDYICLRKERQRAYLLRYKSPQNEIS